MTAVTDLAPALDIAFRVLDREPDLTPRVEGLGGNVVGIVLAVPTPRGAVEVIVTADDLGGARYVVTACTAFGNEDDDADHDHDEHDVWDHDVTWLALPYRVQEAANRAASVPA